MCCNPDQLPNLISYHSLLLLLFSQTSLLCCENTRSLLLPQGLCTCCLLYPSTYLCLTGFPEHLSPEECSLITQASLIIITVCMVLTHHLSLSEISFCLLICYLSPLYYPLERGGILLHLQPST